MMNQILIAAIIILAAMCRCALAQTDDVRSEYTSVEIGDTITAGEGMPSELRTFLGRATTRVLYLISAGDCNVCLSHLKAIDGIARGFPDVEQHVVMFATAPPLARKLLTEYGIDGMGLTALARRDSMMTAALKVRATPVLYLLDRDNRVIAYDKLGGRLLTDRSIRSALLPELRMRHTSDISLRQGSEDYVAGRLLYLSRDAEDDIFYAYDFTFQTLLEFTSDGAILSKAKASPSGFPFLKPKQLLIPEKGSDHDVIVFDFAQPELGRFAVRYLRTPKHQRDSLSVRSHYLTYRRDSASTARTSLFRVKEDPQPKDLLMTGGSAIVSLMPSAADWSSPRRLIEFASVARLKDTGAQRLVYEYPSRAIGPDSTFLDCFDNDSIDLANDPPLTYPTIFPTSPSTFGFYFKGINALRIIDTSLRLLRTVRLSLEDFQIERDCNRRRSSVIEKIIPYHDGYLVLYRKHAFTPESNYTTPDRRFYLQRLDSTGAPASRRLAIPDEVYFEESCMVRDGIFCVVTHKEGAYGLSLYELTER